MNGWQMGYDWAAKNFYIDAKGNKNVDGGKLGEWLASIGEYGNHAAEGVLYYLFH